LQKTILRAYKYRIYPTKTQIEFLENHFGACRFVYNYFWSKYKDTKFPNKTILQKELKELKKDEKYTWLNQINSQSLQVAIHNLIKAYKRALSKEVVKERKIALAKANTPKQKAKALKLGYPKFKSKKNPYQSFNIPQNVKVKNRRVYTPKLKEGIKVKWHRLLPQDWINESSSHSEIYGEINNYEDFIQTINWNNIKQYIKEIMDNDSDSERYKLLKKLNELQQRDITI